MATQQFELLKKSAVTQIQADLQASISADLLLAQEAAASASGSYIEAQEAASVAQSSKVAAEIAAGTSTTKASEAAASANAFPTTYPLVGYKSRVETDLGTVQNVQLTQWLLDNLKTQISTAVVGFSSVAGVKTETSGANQLVSKLYNFNGATYDASQATSANKPFFKTPIALNEKPAIKNLKDNCALTHSNVTLDSTGTSGFTITTVLRPNFQLVGTGANKGTLTSGSIVIYYTLGGSIHLYHDTTGLLVFNIENKFNNKSRIITIEATSASIWLWCDGIRYSLSSGTYTPFLGSISSLLNNNTNDTFVGEIYQYHIWQRALSASEIQLQHAALRTLHPEIEGVDIGNQHWSTSNLEATVDSAGNAIPEVQSATNTELITNAADRDFSSDTGYWTKTAGTTISGGVLNINEASSTNCIAKSILTVGKKYRIQFEIVSITSGSTIGGGVTGLPASTTVGIKVYYFNATSISTGLYVGNNTVATVDNISIQEVGWADSQNAYDSIYALTTGTAAVKDLAGTKAAAMWCHYNNDVATGAIYGKLYNWWAVRLFDLNPIKGWRIPSSADITQLQTYLGGSTVAGGKIKVTGTTYWSSPNTGATNESGLSVLGVGWRSGVDGSFSGIYAEGRGWTSGSGVMSRGTAGAATLEITSGQDLRRGYPIRLLRNEPVGEDLITISTGRFSTDISSTPKKVAIPFGYVVSNILINSSNALTGISAALKNYSDVSQGTIFTGKSVDANIAKQFGNYSDLPVLLQDGYVDIIATGNTGNGMEIEIVLQKVVKS